MTVREMKLRSLWYVLKITYGLMFIVVGIDKFFNILEHWEKYISPLLLPYLPISVMHFMYMLGIFEIIIGFMILTKATRLGAYLALILQLCIVIDLISMGYGLYYDDAVRDFVIAVGAYSLVRLTEIIHSDR